jgi:hypothetical protein
VEQIISGVTHLDPHRNNIMKMDSLYYSSGFFCQVFSKGKEQMEREETCVSSFAAVANVLHVTY